MKKIGTITIAISLIFFGIVLLIRQVDTELGYTIFKFWPSIFILLGGEILFYLQKYGKEEKIRFNFLIILVIILYVMSEGIFAFGNFAQKNNFNFKIDNWDIFDNTTKVDKKFEYNKEKTTLVFKGENANLEIKRTGENKIIFDSKLSVRKNLENPSIDIAQKIEGDNQILDFNNDDIASVGGTLYIPENMAVSFDVKNGKIKGDDDFKNNDLKIDSDNASFNLKGFKSANIEGSNGAIDIADCNTVNIKTDNGKINLSGNVENIDVKTSNGAVDIDNEVCKNVKVSTDNGLIKLRTKNNNFKLTASTDTGVVSINGDNKMGKSVNATYGTGEGSVNLKTDVGAIKVNF